MSVERETLAGVCLAVGPVLVQSGTKDRPASRVFSMLFRCRSTVVDGAPTLNRHGRITLHVLYVCSRSDSYDHDDGAIVYDTLA